MHREQTNQPHERGRGRIATLAGTSVVGILLLLGTACGGLITLEDSNAGEAAEEKASAPKTEERAVEKKPKAPEESGQPPRQDECFPVYNDPELRPVGFYENTATYWWSVGASLDIYDREITTVYGIRDDHDAGYISDGEAAGILEDVELNIGGEDTIHALSTSLPSYEGFHEDFIETLQTTREALYSMMDGYRTGNFAAVAAGYQTLNSETNVQMAEHRERVESEASRFEDCAPPGPDPDPDDFDHEQAIGDYFRVHGVENWEYVYDNLEAGVQYMFTEEEWFRKNQWLWDRNPEIYHILSIERQPMVYGEYAPAEIRITAKDGSSSEDITANFVLEEDGWKYALSEYFTERLMPKASFEEFVEANS